MARAFILKIHVPKLRHMTFDFLIPVRSNITASTVSYGIFSSGNSYSILYRYCSTDATQFAPSATAVTIWRSAFVRTSPAAKIPGTDV